MPKMNPAEILPPADDPRDSRNPSLIARMVAHLKVGGTLPPISVFVNGDGKLETLAGETRRQAHLQAGLEVEVDVREPCLTETDVRLERYRENQWREGFNLIERARCFVDLQRLNPQWTQNELAAAVGEKPAHVTKTLQVSRRLIATLQDRVACGDLSPSHAYLLAQLPPEQQSALGERVISERWKRDRLEREVKQKRGKRVRKAKPTKITTVGGLTLYVPADFDYDAVIEELKNALSRVRKGKKIGETDEETAPVLLPAS
jgi:ParB/RepB/Spo0J family partition protein